ncbi:unnamed protein product [Cuscuta campestris]|uniref:Movement protein n=1 Tax=Cuscuta campestris TaxID=132261 RepID=A0A484LRG6_9ASTE|nr:unnamed protein product [Cuscuta campestris]
MAVSVSVSESLRSVLKGSPCDVGQEEYRVVHLARKGDNKWDKLPVDQIYKEPLLSGLNFLSNYKIKSVKEEFHFTDKQHDVYLLTREDIRRHKKKYDFLHIGLVQALVFPFHSAGIDHRIMACLRDAKHPNMENSILAAFEINLSYGDMEFNWFPNFSVSLSDLLNSNGLVITVEPNDIGCLDGTITFGISYRMCYKLMKGCLQKS